MTEKAGNALGFNLLNEGPEGVAGERRTLESRVQVEVDLRERDPELKTKIRTPFHFFNHMLETVSWRACMNVRVQIDIDGYHLAHVICEDIGITMGQVLQRLWDNNKASGVSGAGYAYSLIDEALTRCAISFEDRSAIHVNSERVVIPENVEDLRSADLMAFFEGFVQGNRSTLHLDILKGVDPHHIWESAFRAFGEALYAAFQPRPWRKGTTPGVKGI
jgi:imidazoleglycerol-phosphate dehydratase